MEGFEGPAALVNYLRGLANEGGEKPFDCSFLVVLPEDVRYKRATFPKGILLCSYRLDPDGEFLCRIQGIRVVLDKKKKMEVFCVPRGSKFILSIVGFEH